MIGVPLRRVRGECKKEHCKKIPNEVGYREKGFETVKKKSQMTVRKKRS